MSDDPINDLALLTAARALADVHIEDLKEPDKMLQAAHMFARSVLSLIDENTRLRAALAEACDRINFLRDNGYHKPFRGRDAGDFAEQTRIEFALMMGLDV